MENKLVKRNISEINYGDKMTITEFAESVFSGWINDDDGSGYLYNGKGECYEFEGDYVPYFEDEDRMTAWICDQESYGFVGVIWFNK